MERLWRREGLKVPAKQPKKVRLWLNDGSCLRLRPARPNHVWSYDFVHHRTEDGRAFRTLNIIDKYSRECLMIRVQHKATALSPGIQTAGAREHHIHRGQKDCALILTLDQPVGAGQFSIAALWESRPREAALERTLQPLLALAAFLAVDALAQGQ